MAVLIGHAVQPLQVFLKRLVIDIAAIFLHRRHHRARADEARHVVDVSVCIVAGDAVAQPQNLAHNEIVGEHSFVLRLDEAGVALLHFTEQAFLGDQQQSLTVNVETTAFQLVPTENAAGGTLVRQSRKKVLGKALNLAPCRPIFCHPR